MSITTIMRGLLAGATLGKRRVVGQMSIRAGEVAGKVEIFSPYGRSLNPVPGGDVLIFTIGGTRDHLVALLDDSALRIPDLAVGEFGDRDQNGQQIVFRHDHLEITTTLPIVINGQSVAITTTGDCVLTTGGAVELGAAGGKKVALDGDSVVAGKVVASSTKVKGT